MKPVAAVVRTLVVSAARTRLDTAMGTPPSAPIDLTRTIGVPAHPRTRVPGGSTMTSPEMPAPQVTVRGEALLVVEPELADVDVTVRVHARDRQTALERCSARQDEVAAV